MYVSELPKDCIECPFCQDIKVNAGMDRLLFCKANKGKAIKNIEKSFDKCIVKNEFQSLADYTEQVRKKGCDKIKNLEQQLKSQPAEIVDKIKKRLCNRLNIIAGYGQMTVDEFSFFIESEFTKDIDEILKEYGEK